MKVRLIRQELHPTRWKPRSVGVSPRCASRAWKHEVRDVRAALRLQGSPFGTAAAKRNLHADQTRSKRVTTVGPPNEATLSSRRHEVSEAPLTRGFLKARGGSAAEPR